MILLAESLKKLNRVEKNVEEKDKEESEDKVNEDVIVKEDNAKQETTEKKRSQTLVEKLVNCNICNAYFLLSTNIKDHKSYKEDVYKDGEWKEAIKEELQAHNELDS
ncbi:hypothetical protein FQR65_LT19184 [Abscondita terminalis]|nr:hypothetical protein FQR65_LT19184 [Abscondita terminalis]